MKALYLIVPLAPLVGAIVAGLFGGLIGRRGAHWVTIVGMTVSFLASLLVFQEVRAGQPFSGAVYTWISGLVIFSIVCVWVLDLPTGPGLCENCGALEKIWRTFFTFSRSRFYHDFFFNDFWYKCLVNFRIL